MINDRKPQIITSISNRLIDVFSCMGNLIILNHVIPGHPQYLLGPKKLRIDTKDCQEKVHFNENIVQVSQYLFV